MLSTIGTLGGICARSKAAAVEPHAKSSYFQHPIRCDHRSLLQIHTCNGLLGRVRNERKSKYSDVDVHEHYRGNSF